MLEEYLDEETQESCAKRNLNDEPGGISWTLQVSEGSRGWGFGGGFCRSGKGKDRS
jgi:hypothetical protein